MKRRTVLQVAAAMAAIGAAPVFASQRGWVLQAGLPTDDAFAHGTGLQRRLAWRADGQGYATLVQALRHTPGEDVLALVDTRHALLVEQAARDSGSAVRAWQRVSADEAQAIGRWLAQGSARPWATAPHGALVALQLNT